MRPKIRCEGKGMRKIVEKWDCCGVLIGGDAENLGSFEEIKKLWFRIYVDKNGKVY